MTLRALIFDVDGTLCETEEAHRQAFNDTFASEGLGWEWSVADYTRLLKTTGGKERMRAYQDEVGGSLTDAQIAALHRAKTARYGEIMAMGGLALRRGVADMIARGRAAGLRVAVATTTNRPNVDSLAQAIWGQPAAKIFDVIAAGDEVAAKKPAPDVFLLALDGLGISPDEGLAFEDSTNGVRSALGAGLRVVVTPSVYTAMDDFAGADWIVPSLEQPDLPQDLRRLIG